MPKQAHRALAPALLSPPEIAARLEISRQCASKWMRKGFFGDFMRLPGGDLRCRASGLDDFLRARTVQVGANSRSPA